MATIVVLEVATRTHVRFQSSSDLWENDIHVKLNPKFAALISRSHGI